MSNEQLSMYLGPHHLWGQGARGKGGSKWKLAPLTHRSLPSLPNPCCHSPHSQLAGPHSQCPMNSLLCIGVSTTSGGKGLGGNMGASWSWLPSLPDHSPCSHLAPACSSSLPAYSQLTPAHSQLTPAHFQLAPVCSQLASAHSQWPCMCWDPHHLWDVRGKVGVSWSELGSKLEWTGEWAGASCSKPSEWNVILGFRAPTTSGRKTSIITYSAYVSPPPGSKISTQCPFT